MALATPVSSRAPRATRLGLVALSIAVAGWSITNLIPKVTQLSGIGFAFYRLWLGALVMVVALTLSGRKLTWPTVKASVPGGALFGLNIVLFVSALKMTGVADALVIGALQPALTLMVAGPLFGERITRSHVAWTAASVAGVALVVVGASGAPTWSLAGDALAVVALVLWTGYFLVSKRTRERVPALEYMTAVTVVAAVVVTPIAIGTGELGHAVRPADWLWLALFLIGAQGGHVLVAWAHAEVDVTISSLFVLAQPVIASVAAMALLGEPLTVLEIVGGAVVLASVAAIVRRARRTDLLEEEFEPVSAFEADGVAA
jgi:drug/metabolite transporter (DMT)-like permease